MSLYQIEVANGEKSVRFQCDESARSMIALSTFLFAQINYKALGFESQEEMRNRREALSIRVICEDELDFLFATE